MNLAGRPCALCSTGESTRKGEHVIPQWMLDDLLPMAEPGERGYSIEHNGDPVPDRHGATRTTSEASRFLLPVCTSCNTTLSIRFEQDPAKGAVRKLFDADGPRVLDGAETAAAAVWLAKTVSLLAHPDVGNTNRDWTAPPEAWPADQIELWEWMVNGGDPPDGLSLWIARFSRTDTSGVLEDSIGRIRLPDTQLGEDGTVRRFHHNSFGLIDVGLTVVFHPGWPIDHPIADAGNAVRLWPNPPAGFTFTSLPELAGQNAYDFQTLFQPGARLMCEEGFFDQTLPPLHIGWDAAPRGTIDVPGVRGYGVR